MLKLFLLAAFIAAVLCGCNSTDPVVEQNTLKLTAVDASVTETYLHISLGTLRNNEEITIYRNGTPAIHFTAVSKDTFITDSALSENTIYKYTAVAGINNQETARSNEVAIKTLLPTSHDFVWQKYLFGEYSYSELNDVDVISDSNVWAVGRIRLLDSLGQPDEQIYNALEFNNSRGKFIRIPVEDYGGHFYNIPLSTVITLEENNYWFSTLANLIKWDGEKYSSKAFFANSLPFYGQVNKIWGNKETNILCAGNNGSIYNYSIKNGNWLKITSYTSKDIYDIWGISKTDGSYEAYCTVTDFDNFENNKNLKINSENIVSFIKANSKRWTSTLWTASGFPIFIAGDGIFENKNGTWNEVDFGEKTVIERIRGNAPNDIIAVGHFGTVAHFNGLDWKVYPELKMEGVYKAVSIKYNIIAIAGMEGNKAVLIIGKRN